MSASAYTHDDDEVQPVEFVIDRTPSQITVIDLVNEANSVFVVPRSNVNTTRRCSFCECSGHTVRNCTHSDIDKLNRCAQFMYLTTCRYLRTHPFSEITHKRWLDNLSTSEYKILAKLNRLDTNSRTKRNEYQEKLHTYYTEYALNELRNDRSTNAVPILAIYAANILAGIVTTEEVMRYAMRKLDSIIKQSGRNLLDMNRIRQWVNANIDFQFSVTQPRYFENPVQPTAKILPTMNDNVELETEVHEECPICYSEMTKENAVQLGCKHSFCGDCIVRQIKSSRKPTADCGLCRSTIKECRSTSRNLLEQMSSNFAN
jgi:hypothetical protein